ncbi:hypothetical protein HDU98_000284 [Podochytrium sp. JEL0797]|nr:hypothetical protein HDU98_000284 [Podochytrium sp. JEL0797]
MLEIETPAFTRAGSFVVDLIDITDANKCPWTLETPDVSIEVLPQRPSGAFRCPRAVSMLDGDSATLPISLIGRQPFNIKYVNKRNPEVVFELKNVNERDSIRVHSPGSYEILEVSDMFCAGNAKPVDCEVTTIPRPKLEIPANQYDSVDPKGPFVRKGVCEGVSDTFEVLATGKAPFHLKYHIDQVDPSNGNLVARIATKEERSGGSVARIPLLTDRPDAYQYTFYEITDDNYKKPVASHGTSNAGSPTLRQTVLSRPNAVFTDSREMASQCLGDNPDDTNNSVPIRLSGTPPFALTLELKRENFPSEEIHLQNLDSHVHHFRPTTLAVTGKYTIQLVKMRDASGCERVFDKEDVANQRRRDVSDVARISDLNARHICVGDVLSYTLQGTPPFTISYEFNGVKQDPVSIVDPLLTLYAGEAGTVAITNVCNHMNCCTKPVDIRTTIHDLPSAIIEGGEEVMEDIREGEETVFGIDFLGVPPFSFTYARRDLPGSSNHAAAPAKGRKASKSAKSEESFTITNIQTNHYDVTTSQEGFFHVTAVYDKYCGFPRVHQKMGAANAVVKAKKE